MTDLKLNPEGYFEFDLAHGRIGYAQEGERVVAFPAEGLLGLIHTGFDQVRRSVAYTVGLHLGENCGKKIVQVLGDDPMKQDLSPESFLDHVNAVFALHGLGSLSLQTWGELLLVEWYTDLGDPAEQNLQEFQEGVLSGVMRAVTSQPFEAASVDEYGEGTRFVVGNSAMVDWTKLWMGEGLGLGEIVERLHAGRHLETEAG